MRQLCNFCFCGSSLFRSFETIFRFMRIIKKRKNKVTIRENENIYWKRVNDIKKKKTELFFQGICFHAETRSKNEDLLSSE